ncbi:SPFH domain-containing protein, partial [Bacillus cereus]
ALRNITATTLRNAVGSMELDETLSSRDSINTTLQIALDEATDHSIKLPTEPLKILPATRLDFA